ncbi:MAG: hypothetical protein UY50_C0025G0037 [Parcubacteria group bacterium GW2011_GWA2_49_9]|nr:MAG: hypothetical protein UY50_C0025G0037 [Parcubacteria group bacterium GW2011_GWA2_49_9]
MVLVFIFIFKKFPRAADGHFYFTTPSRQAGGNLAWKQSLKECGTGKSKTLSERYITFYKRAILMVVTPHTLLTSPLSKGVDAFLCAGGCCRTPLLAKEASAPLARGDTDEREGLLMVVTPHTLLTSPLSKGVDAFLCAGGCCRTPLLHKNAVLPLLGEIQTSVRSY